MVSTLGRGIIRFGTRPSHINPEYQRIPYLNVILSRIIMPTDSHMILWLEQ